MKKLFKLTENNTTISQEIVAGITIFLSSAYIIFVNPLILSKTGMDSGAVYTATILSAVIATLIMAFMANAPLVLGPGMGINAFFSFTVVLNFGYSWQEALAAVFISGIIFFIISISGLRQMIISAIPTSLKDAIAVGIGFFITFVGMRDAQIIVADPAVFVSIGDFTNPKTLISISGFIITCILFIRKVPAAIFIGFIITLIISITAGITPIPQQLITTAIPSLKPTFASLFSALHNPSFYTLNTIVVIFSFFFIDFFDTSGMLIAMGKSAKLISSDGTIRSSQSILIADSIGTISGSILGTSSVTTYVESLTGINAGGRTGLTALTAAICFLISLLFSPLLTVITPAITAPALMMVGCMMILSINDINWTEPCLAIPSFFTIICMVLTYSIAEGIAIGFFLYPICMIASGRTTEVHPIMYILLLLFSIYFIF